MNFAVAEDLSNVSKNADRLVVGESREAKKRSKGIQDNYTAAGPRQRLVAQASEPGVPLVLHLFVARSSSFGVR